MVVLPLPLGTEQSNEFTLFNAETYVVRSLEIAVSLVDVFKLDVHYMRPFLLPMYSMTLLKMRSKTARTTSIEDTANAGTYLLSPKSIST